jgi:hypothetical protein
MTEKHFYKRNLPHLYFNDGIYFITFRLADSLPSNKVAAVKAMKKNIKLKERDNFKRLLDEYDEILDSSLYGKKYLANP